MKPNRRSRCSSLVGDMDEMYHYNVRVIELGVAFAVIALLVGSAFAVALLPWSFVFGAGLWLGAIGLVVGLPTGFWYHVALRRRLAARGGLPADWWWRPTAHHDRLDAADRRRVMPWFYAGAVGFVLTIAGCILAAVGVVRGR